MGGGFYSDFAALRVSEAWEIFGEGNGATSLTEMRARVSRYRRAPIAPTEDPLIGCVFIPDARVFGVENLAAPAPDFAPNIVQGKSYDLAGERAAGYFADLLYRLLQVPVEIDFSEPWHRAGPVYGDPRLAPRRLGQHAFQAVVLDAYHRRCAVTGERIRPVLQVAHIRPLPSGGEHRLDNGLLLRSDVHTLFDRGYLGVDLKYRLLVSPRLRDEFGNGEQFYARERQQIAVPPRLLDRPNREFLEWHLGTVFKAS